MLLLATVSAAALMPSPQSAAAEGLDAPSAVARLAPQWLHADPIITGAPPETRTAPAPAPFQFGVFGSLQLKTGQMPYAEAWGEIKGRMVREQILFSSCGSDNADCPAGLRSWRQTIAALQELPATEQIARLNRAVNRAATYADDSDAYNVDDYWVTPAEFFGGKADCEDYAIVKFFSLLALGFEPQQLRLVILRDRRRSPLHAVVTVDLAGEIYVLDSLFDAPVKHQYLLRYQPLYSFNTEASWAHITTPQIRAKFLAQLHSGPARVQPVALPKRKPAPSTAPIVESTLLQRHFNPHAGQVSLTEPMRRPLGSFQVEGAAG